MLKVNGNETKILRAKIYFVNHYFNGKKDGYQGYVYIRFKMNEKIGYFGFYLDKTIDKDISCYANRKYKCVPEMDDEQLSLLEIFDSVEFYDICNFENEMKLNLDSIEENKIRAMIEINEKFLTILFDSYLDIVI